MKGHHIRRVIALNQPALERVLGDPAKSIAFPLASAAFTIPLWPHYITDQNTWRACCKGNPPLNNANGRM
ncbi:MAG: hypothetical protein JO033_20605 [Acidobacteriaceae bacterium]|nr:hypothetical protein [Acidobacteriaceae bacterium]MBV9502734.1 hypothetical protein [Acidobacteriaceae bacterium]